MLYFHVLHDIRIRGKFWVNTIISLIYSKYCHLSLLEPRWNNLSNPEAYSEPCHTSNMGCLAKIVNSWKSLKTFNCSCKALHFRFLTEFWIRLCNLQFIVWENREYYKDWFCSKVNLPILKFKNSYYTLRLTLSKTVYNDWTYRV